MRASLITLLLAAATARADVTPPPHAEERPAGVAGAPSPPESLALARRFLDAYRARDLAELGALSTVPFAPDPDGHVSGCSTPARDAASLRALLGCLSRADAIELPREPSWQAYRSFAALARDLPGREWRLTPLARLAGAHTFVVRRAQYDVCTAVQALAVRATPSGPRVDGIADLSSCGPDI